MRTARYLAAICTLVLATAAVTACTSDPTVPHNAASDSEALPIAAGPRDLALALGTLLPMTGSLASLGPAQVVGAELASDDINRADSGLTLRLVNRDSGDTTTDTASVSTSDLLDQHVSAILGASASAVSKIVIDQITGANVVQISPSNTAVEFTTWNDHGLYFRTAPSDQLQGEVLGNTIANTGASTLGILSLNDAYGRGLDDTISSAFESAGGRVIARESFNEGDSTFSTQVAGIVAAHPDAVAIVTFDQARTILPALIAAGISPKQLFLVDGNLLDYSANFQPGLLAGARGTAPGAAIDADAEFAQRVRAAAPDVKDFTYASEPYDAVVLVALAAYAANSSNSVEIAKYLRQVSGGTGHGTKVTTFAEGASLLARGQQIDYDGVSGPITFDEHGDPTEATIGIFEAQTDNTWKRIGDG